MGSSALRALSIGRPVVVQGEQGFSKVFEPDGLPYFLAHGIWGGAEHGLDGRRLAAQLRAAAGRSRARAELGAFGRQAVEERFSLRRARREATRDLREVLRPRPPRERRRTRPPRPRAALRLEFDNHDPRLKRARRQTRARAAHRRVS